jgi:RNA polymerase sigma-70 factor, ECF subfamily
MNTTITTAETAAAQTARPDASEMALLKLARDGDGDAFGELADAYCAKLHAHCYRMLGSAHDAEDALQDALLRAWCGLPGFEGRSSVRSWLYAIATNTALDIARRRSRRELPMNCSPAAGNRADPGKARTGRPWPDPHPGHWLAATAETTPDARYEQRESVELAFIAALRHLPPLQRAALLLREVAGFPAAEIARQLGTSTASVNSALQRARATARDRIPARSQQQVLRAPGDQRIKATAQRYADAMERGDTDTLISMLTQDAGGSQTGPSARITGLWEHHAVAAIDADSPALGEVVAGIPNHVRTAVNPFPELLVTDQGQVIDRRPVAARAASR